MGLGEFGAVVGALLVLGVIAFFMYKQCIKH